MNKLKLAWAIVFPLVGCTATVGDDASVFGVGAGGTVGSAGASGAGQVASSSGSGGIGSGSGPGTAGVNSGSGGAGGSSPVVVPGGGSAGGGMPAAGGASNGGACSVAVLPGAVQTLLANRCVTCHGPTPLAGLPALFDYATLTAPAKSDPTKTNAVVALARLQSASMPMPPAPGTPATASEIAALQDFITQGYPKPVCMNGAGGGGSGGSSSSGGGGMGGSPGMDPLNAMPTCTSMSSWSNGNRGSASMNPGLACISCHKSGEGPSFNIAGTVYPTGHEPDRCNSTVGNAGARIVITGADGKQLTLTPNGAGNFSSGNTVKTPYQAKVTYQGRERLMLTAQTSGDCNSCHTQNGMMMAPGRITVP